MLPMLLEQLVAFRLGSRCGDVEPGAVGHLVLPNLPVPVENVEMVPHLAQTDLEGARDGPQVVSRQQPKVFENTCTGGMRDRCIAQQAHRRPKAARSRPGEIDWRTRRSRLAPSHVRRNARPPLAIPRKPPRPPDCPGTVPVTWRWYKGCGPRFRRSENSPPPVRSRSAESPVHSGAAKGLAVRERGPRPGPEGAREGLPEQVARTDRGHPHEACVQGRGRG